MLPVAINLLFLTELDASNDLHVARVTLAHPELMQVVVVLSP